MSFSALMINFLPDIQVQSNGQVFPRFSYRKAGEKAKGGIFEDAIDVPEGYILEDNILDEALTEYHTYYGDIEIHKDDIFFYVYAMLHHKGYRKKYANNLVKEFPRIPMTPDIEDFWEFAKAGQRLGYLHAFYEELVGYPLGMDYVLHFDENNDNHYRFEKIKYINKESKTEIQINDYLTLIDIPKEAQEYQVNGRSALDWIVDRYQIKTDTKESGITNDPNDLFEDPRDFIQLIKQVTQVSVETVEIVNSLPEQFEPK